MENRKALCCGASNGFQQQIQRQRLVAWSFSTHQRFLPVEPYWCNPCRYAGRKQSNAAHTCPGRIWILWLNSVRWRPKAGIRMGQMTSSLSLRLSLQLTVVNHPDFYYHLTTIDGLILPHFGWVMTLWPRKTGKSILGKSRQNGAEYGFSGGWSRLTKILFVCHGKVCAQSL